MVDKSNLFEDSLPESDGIYMHQWHIGDMFRQTRESKGIKIEEVTKTTRIRPFFVEAIECEDWGSLPSPGFIPGFLKTYANYLGMDATEILAKYNANRRAGEERLVPLDKKGKIYKKNLFIWVFGALFIAIIGTGIVLDPLPWKERYAVFLNLMKSEIVTPQEPENHTYNSSVSNDEYNNGEEKLTVSEHDFANSSEPIFSGQRIEVASAMPPQHSAADTQKEPPLSTLHASGVSNQPKSNEDTSLQRQIPEKGYLLEVKVLADVFLRVKIDDLPSKDYMLKADKTLSWTAEEAFDLRIGNAASLIILLNGEEVKDIGAPGAVVNLRLPKIL